MKLYTVGQCGQCGVSTDRICHTVLSSCNKLREFVIIIIFLIIKAKSPASL